MLFRSDRSGHKKHSWCSSFHKGGIQTPELVVIFTRAVSASAVPVAEKPAPAADAIQTLTLTKLDVVLNGCCGKDYDGDNFIESSPLSSAMHIEGGSAKSPDSIARSYIKFSLLKAPKSCVIVSAQLQLRVSSYGGRKGPFPQKIRAGLTDKDIESVLPRSWSSLKLIDFFGTAHNDTIISKQTEPGDIISIDVTNAIKAIIESGQPNNGMMLRFVEENLVDQHYRNAFVTIFHQGGRQSPELIIQYKVAAR